MLKGGGVSEGVGDLEVYKNKMEGRNSTERAWEENVAGKEKRGFLVCPDLAVTGIGPGYC